MILTIMLINFKKCCRRKNQINLTLYIKFALIHRIYIINVSFVFVYTPVEPDVLYVFEREYKCSTSLNNMSDLLYFDKNSSDLFGKDAFNV